MYLTGSQLLSWLSGFFFPGQSLYDSKEGGRREGGREDREGEGREKGGREEGEGRREGGGLAYPLML